MGTRGCKFELYPVRKSDSNYYIGSFITPYSRQRPLSGGVNALAFF